jgi:hypothetical protein
MQQQQQYQQQQRQHSLPEKALMGHIVKIISTTSAVLTL